MSNVTAFKSERPEAAEWHTEAYRPDTSRTAKQYGPTIVDDVMQAVAAIGLMTLTLIGCII